MLAKKISVSPAMLLAFLAIFILGTASAATAGSLINGKKIKKGSIPYSALSKDAKKKLAGKTGPQGPAGPAGAAAARYWAYVTESGALGRSSGNITSLHTTNGGMGNQYQVQFPADVSQCGYSVTTGDTDPIGAGFAADGEVPAVTRSSVNPSTLAVSLWQRNTPNNNFNVANMATGAFYIQVFC